MNKTENLYSALRGLEKNIQKLTSEDLVLDYRIQNVFIEWMNAERFGRKIDPDTKHLQCKLIESWNNRIAENERRLRFQKSLHSRLMEIYDGLLRVEFAKFLN